ncbi:MAG TPA: hypothetical protein VM282_21235 [Acidimicrobiales bacterium]|nr:hypothetical protein [Acidimicrobiales bacterium]
MTQVLMAQAEQTAATLLVKTCGAAGVGGLPSDFGRTENRDSPARCIVVVGGSPRRQDKLRSALDNSRQPRQPRWIKSVRGVGDRLEPSY